ncbi:hypothetical protein FCV62_00890 [Vibrio kanaloae]|uniref:hypothetical protein n=1 Tax=Vibrio kanaloae TaxID=170673 RepID=UPI0010BE3329|nr:hypothetical protein [Vibrio kanaloae]TKF82300.1 hypothetical protein FCV62_00890 [Vibrio kanaloae]
MSFFRTFSDDLHELNFAGLSPVEKKRIMQGLYDKGHDVKTIAKKLNLNEAFVRSRINAHRGRGPALA